MAKIRDYAVTIESATSASSVLEMPTHESGDLLLIFFNKDSSGGGPSTPAGWSSLQSQSSAGSHGQVFAKRAASSSEAVTLSYTTETSITIVVSVRNCYGSTVADAVSDSNVSGSDDSAYPLTGGTITPSYNNSLIFSFLSTDVGQAPTTLPTWVDLFGGDSGANSGSVSYTYQKTAASITHSGYWGIYQDDSRAFMIVVRDDGNETEVDAYVDRATNPCTLLTPHLGVTTVAAVTAANLGEWKTATNLTITSIGGKTATWKAVTATADSGYNPFRGSTAFAGTSSKTILYGNQFTFTTSPDLTLESGIVFGTWVFTLPRDYIDVGKSSTGGVITGFASSANGRFWSIGAQFAKTTLPDKRMNYAIEVTNTDSDYYTTATPPTLTAITELYILNQSYYGAAAVKFNELWRLNTTVLAGGTATNPIDFEEIINAVNKGSGNIPLMVQQGASTINTNFSTLSIINAVMSGYWNIIEDCWVYNMTNFCGWMRSGSFENIELGVGDPGMEEGSMTYFDDVVPMYPGVTSTLKMNTDVTVSFTNHKDITTITYMPTGSLLNVGLLEGNLIIDASCTGGSIIVSGVGILTNNSLLGIDDIGLISQYTIGESVLDVQTTDHEEVGSIGKAIADAGTGGNPWASVIEGGTTAKDILRYVLSFISGEATGAGTTEVIFKSLDGIVNRITMTVDDKGNRSSAVLDGSD